MKTVVLDVLKKNRKYFAAKTERGFELKILIDENSQDIPLQKGEFLIEDISVRTKYGTDIIYKIVGAIKKEDKNKIYTIKHDLYNKFLHDQCKKLGGKWDGEEKVWVLPSLVSDKAEELDDVYNSEKVNVEIKALSRLFGDQDAVDFCGYSVAKAYGRDSGAKLGDGFSQLCGAISSGGSMKNWGSIVSEGSCFRFNISKKLLEMYREAEQKYWEIKEI